MLSYESFVLAVWARSTDGKLFPSWTSTDFKANFLSVKKQTPLIGIVLVCNSLY